MWGIAIMYRCDGLSRWVESWWKSTRVASVGCWNWPLVLRWRCWTVCWPSFPASGTGPPLRAAGSPFTRGPRSSCRTYGASFQVGFTAEGFILTPNDPLLLRNIYWPRRCFNQFCLICWFYRYCTSLHSVLWSWSRNCNRRNPNLLPWRLRNILVPEPDWDLDPN